MMALLLVTLLADVRDPATTKTNLPEVRISDERPEGIPPSHIKITLTNRTKANVRVILGPSHRMLYEFRLYDEHGRPARLRRLPNPPSFEGVISFNIKAGESRSWFSTPEEEYRITPGRYQVEVIYHYVIPGAEIRKEIRSNRITKTFP